VSSECGKSKTSGALFTELLRQEGVTAQQVNHHGNSPSHDLRPAARVGLGVQPFLEGNLNRYEAILEAHSWATEGLASAMAGRSRLARLSVPVAQPKEVARREVAAGVAGPALVSYTLWILHRAEELGLKHLYFLSRDGQILLEIARRLARS